MDGIDTPGPIATRFAEAIRTLDVSANNFEHRVANAARGLVEHLTIAIGLLESENVALRLRVDALEQRLGE